MINKSTAVKLFEDNSCLVGEADVIPDDIAREKLGSEAVKFARKFNTKYSNAYGIGDYTMQYLTRKGFFTAVTYYNVSEQRNSINCKEMG